MHPQPCQMLRMRQLRGNQLRVSPPRRHNLPRRAKDSDRNPEFRVGGDDVDFRACLADAVVVSIDSADLLPCEGDTADQLGLRHDSLLPKYDETYEADGYGTERQTEQKKLDTLCPIRKSPSSV